MNSFVTVGQVNTFPASNKLACDIDDRFIVVIRIDDEFFCIDDVCTHDGGPLSEGEITDHCIACPRHGAMFDVRTGDAVLMPATEKTGSHAVRIVGNDIQVQITDD